MAELMHQIWEDEDGLPGYCLAGPSGESFRKLFGPNAK
jgi:hypothetical protein